MMRYLIIGLGVSGTANARYLLKKNHQVFALDDEAHTWEKQEVQALAAQGLKKLDSFDEPIDQVILSSGIHPQSPLLKQAKQKKLSILSEAEFALQKIKAKCIAITGTNGKTTSCFLLAHILNACGKKVQVAGNAGKPIIEFVDVDVDYIICELSSYQLQRIDGKYFSHGSLLNISSDHLDWHGSYNNYVKAKLRLQHLCEHFLISKSCYMQVKEQISAKAQLVGDSIDCEVAFLARALFYQQKYIAHIPKNSPFYQFERENMAHAFAIAIALGCRPIEICKAIASFSRLEHRLEKLEPIDGIEIINDSKATNIASTLAALQTFRKKQILWIAGGEGKGQDFSMLQMLIQVPIKHIFFIGKNTKMLTRALQKFPHTAANNMETAVQKAFAIAAENDVILLSPMCSSFDQFENYIDRGNKFKYYVNKIKNKRNVQWQKSILS